MRDRLRRAIRSELDGASFTILVRTLLGAVLFSIAIRLLPARVLHVMVVEAQRHV